MKGSTKKCSYKINNMKFNVKLLEHDESPAIFL